MSDTRQRPDWWQASDGKWYPPLPPPVEVLPPPPDLSTLPPPPTNVQNRGMASMVVGLFGLLCGWVPLFGIVPAMAGPFAIVLGVRALRAARGEAPSSARTDRVTATVGIVSGVIATGFLLLWAVAFFYSLLGGQDPFRGL